MAIQTSGPISFSDLAVEFGDTPPYSFSEFYRDGGKVPSVNVNVASSGSIRLGTFFGAVNELLQTVTANASINAQTIFGSDWGSAVPKRLSIPSGVVIGPLTIPSGMGGTLEVDVSGEIQGLGGSANSGAGGHAITANSSFTLNVFSGGAVRGGGGGGGLGGTGGGGSYTQTTYQYRFNNQNYWLQPDGGGWQVIWNSLTYGTGGFTRGPLQYTQSGDQYYGVTGPVYSTVNTNGGSGGAGGRGRGYGQSLASGSGGSAGGTNAGTGGTGGTGGDWGASGATGNTGANGNRTNGSGGSAGGSAGRAVLMNAGTVTVNNSGTINGAY